MIFYITTIKIINKMISYAFIIIIERRAEGRAVPPPLSGDTQKAASFI
jgi:hypothetical protein